MKKSLLLLFLVLFLGQAPLASGERQLLDQLVAVVNDEAITQSELDIILHPVYEHYKTEWSGQELYRRLTEARRKLLNQLIEDRLVYQEAKKRAIEVDEEQIEEQMEKFKKKFPDQNSLEKALRDQGLTLTAVRERLQRQNMIRTLHDQEIRAKIVISPAEIENYYAEHSEEFQETDTIRVRSITLKKSAEAREKGLKDEGAWSKIEEARRKVLAGGSFPDLAVEFSQDSNAEKGGLGDWMQRGDMIPEIDEVIFKLTKGQVSEIVETSMGYHLFLLEEKKEEPKRSLEEVRDEIHGRLFQKKSEARFEEWMSNLKKTAYISIR